MPRDPYDIGELDDARRAAERRFDVDRALGLAHLSQAAYLDFAGDDVRIACNRAGYRLRATIAADATELLVCQNDERAALVYRGTTANSWADWKTNFKAQFRPVKGSSGEVHSGFAIAVDRVASQVREVLEALTDEEPERPIVFAGHSQGGANATESFRRFRSPRYRLEPEVTFGEPRVFSRDVAGLAPALRFVNAGDLVPRVPLLVMGYGHRERLEYFTRDGRLLADPPWWMTAPRFAFSKVVAPGSGFRDHRIGRYVGKLKALRLSIPWSVYRSA